MSAVLVAAGDKTVRYVELFRAAAPALRIFAVDDAHNPATIDYLVGWKLPPDFLKPYTHLKAIFGLGAGVDAFLARADLPANVPVVKLADAGMAEQMVEYALIGVLTWQRRLCEYSQQQMQREWQPLEPRLRADVRVSVLGLGAIGSEVAKGLAAFGYRVTGWSRSAKDLANIRTVAGADTLDALLAETDVLVNVLPSTPETRGLLDHAKLARLPRGAYVINCSRGDQLDADALLKLVESNYLSGALLDVFAQEPLPADSPLWGNANIRITPHVAAITLPAQSVEQIVANIRKHEAGQAMTGVVNRERGY